MFREAGSNLTVELIKKGIPIAIEHGRLTSNCFEFVNKNRAYVIRDILSLMNIAAYSYESYSTGHYGKYKAPGVTLQFTNLATGESRHSIFNVQKLTTQRKSKNRKAGKQLPKNHFVPKDKTSNWRKFWRKTLLDDPRRPSVFHEEMSKLKPLRHRPRLQRGRAKSKYVCFQVRNK